MAYKPSARRSEDSLIMDLDIRPVMNLMVVLIPLLLLGAQWVKLGAIEINTPPTKSVGGDAQNNEQKDKKETDKKIGLKIAITHDGITIGNAAGLLSSEKAADDGGPTIPLLPDGSYDYTALKAKLIEIKGKIAGKGYKDENRAVISGGKGVKYQVIIDVIDKIQSYPDDKGIEKPLFPEINFATITV